MTEPKPNISPAQCRAARALLGWFQPDLAKAAGVGRVTIQDFESGKRATSAGTLVLLRQAFESAGVVFLIDAEGEGVKLLASQKRPSK